MSEGLESSFDRMGLHAADGHPHSPPPAATGGTTSPHQSHLPSQSQSSQQPQSQQPPQPRTQAGSLRSPSFPYTSAPQQATTGGSLSASARFEKFFATGNENGDVGASPGGAHAAYAGSPVSATASSPISATGLPATSSAFGSFGHSFAQNPMGSGNFDSSRRLTSNARGALPSQWAPASDFGGSGSGFYPGGGGSQPGSGFISHPGGASGSVLDEDVIPTAIVVKNIPFSVKREQLLQIIEELQIPMPYAFNYHFDQGVFRGLAFANFRSSEEADAVVAALNGFDVQGRKLRVEYKKVLQAGEKERIEKEKAIKRMQSMQIEKERLRREGAAAGVGMPPPPQAGMAPSMWSSMHAPTQQAPGTSASGASPAMPLGVATGLEQPYAAGPPGSSNLAGGSVYASPSIARPPPSSAADAHTPLTADSLRAVPNASPGAGMGAPSERSGGASVNRRDELDLNDPATLEIYSRVLLFKDDRMRDELSFSRSLSPMERRTVHLVAQKLGLYHYSMGEGDERYVVVTKNEQAPAQRSLRSQASTIGRNHREMHTHNGLLAAGSSATTGRAAGLLRMKKSAPDMKRPREEGSMGASFGFGPSASAAGAGGGGGSSNPGGGASSGGSGAHVGGSGGLLSPGSSMASSMSRRSNSNLREGYSATMGRAPRGAGGAAGLASLFSVPFDVPPVPSLPGGAADPQGTGGNASSPVGANGSAANLLRQPRGPPTPGAHEGARNFASQRARITVASGGDRPSSGLNGRGGGDASDAVRDASLASLSSSSTSSSSPAPSYKLNDADVTTHSPLEI